MVVGKEKSMAAIDGWRVSGERDRGRMLTERRQRVKESEGGLLKTGKSKGDDGGG